MYTTRSILTIILLAVPALLATLAGIYLKLSFEPVDLTGTFDASSSAYTFKSADIDGDGVKNTVILDMREPDRFIELANYSFGVINQLYIPHGDSNYTNYPSWADIDNDRLLELGIYYALADSFVVQFYDFLDKKIVPANRIAFPAGDPGDDRRWDGYYCVAGNIQANDDGVADVLFHAHTNNDFQPRALIAYDMIGDSIIWQKAFGAAISEVQIGDYDGDGEQEIVMGSRAFGNGPVEGVGGMSDHVSYIIMLDRHGNELWKIVVGGYHSWCGVAARPFSKMTESNVLAVVTPSNLTSVTSQDSARYSRGRLLALSAKTGEILRERDIGEGPSAWQAAAVPEIGWSVEPGLITLGRDGRIRIYGEDLNLRCESRAYMGPSFTDVADADGDGSPEILLATTDNQHVLLNCYLQELAFFSNGNFPAGRGVILKRNGPEPGRLILDSRSISSVELPDMPPLWLVAIYSWIGNNGWITGLTATLLLIVLPAAIYSRQRSRLQNGLLNASESITRPGAGIFGLDASGRIIYANVTARRILELPERWRRKPLSRLMPKRGAGEFLTRVKDLLSGEQPPEDLLIPFTPAGSMKLLWLDRAGEFRYLGEQITLVAISDKHKRGLPEILAEFYWYAKTRAHEMVGDLGKIGKTLDEARLTMENTPDRNAPQPREYLDSFQEKLEQVTDEMKCLLRLEKIEPELKQHDPVTLINDATVDAVSALETLKVENACQNSALCVITDEELFRKILIELIRNASRAIDADTGKIIIDVKPASDLHAGEAVEDFTLTVKDNGCGMSDEEMKEVMRTSYTTTRDSGGTGMGLTIVQWMCDLLHADLSIDSTEGEGTTVTVRYGKDGTKG